MTYSPNITSELLKRKWGLAGSRDRIEGLAKSLMIKHNYQFKLIGQTYGELPTTNLKLTPDGLKTIIATSCPQMITVCENHPRIYDYSKKSKYTDYNLSEQEPNSQDKFGDGDNFVFSNSGRHILHLSDDKLWSMDLETGQITGGPSGVYNRELFKFHGNSLLIAHRIPLVLKKITWIHHSAKSSSMSKKNDKTVGRIKLQRLCRIDNPSIDSPHTKLIMDINPFDYSTLAILNLNQELYVYDIRKLHSNEPPSRKRPLMKLGAEELLFSLNVPSLGSSCIKFSPSGSKIAVQYWRPARVFCGYNEQYIIVFDLNDVEHPRKVDVTAPPPFDYSRFCWYDDHTICFSNGQVVAWNIETNQMSRLFPSCGGGVYVHPKLPLIANYDLYNKYCYENEDEEEIPYPRYQLWGI